MPDVGVAQLRRELKDWLERARAGEEVVVTDRGRPVARISGVDRGLLLDELTAQGVISPPGGDSRPGARGRPRATSDGSVSDLVVAERDARR